ncbi:MAG: serine/threonine-protein kinase, partial [Acidobacteriota bacterium]
GRGGMGVVYRGLRDDEAFRREVAIKVLAWDGLGPDARRRLDVERRILASLDHPGIARIYDGGTAPSGLPYLVMEHIEGEPIDAYCDRLELSVRQRVELFREVCEAVQASHQNLVVHCDLKPSNILVTAEGRPKLLDFGIAKLLGAEALGAAGGPVTRWPRPLTPQYASPEQIRGEAISTVSDVYSLGVLLFKMLTGRRPYALEGLSAAEAEQRLETHTERPSATAAAAGAVDRSRQIRGDLDAIVLKAMRSEADQRYGSVEQLSADLGRYLEGLPVQARQGDTRYRLGKLIRRHRAAVATAALFVGVLSAYALSMASMAGRLAAERDRLQAMNEFTLGVFDVGSPGGETQAPTLADAVHQNVALIDERHQDQPEVLAAVLGTAADIYIQLEESQRARQLAERALAIHAATDGE